MRVKTLSLAPVVGGLWLLYLCGALLWLCGLDVTSWRFWAVVLPVATLQPVCAALGAALGRRRVRYVAGVDVTAGRTEAEEFEWDDPDGDEVFEWDDPGGRLLPGSYLPATWHCTLPVDAQGRLGLAFRLETGEVLRLALDLGCARSAAETLAFYLRGHEMRPAPDESAGPSPAPQDRG